MNPFKKNKNEDEPTLNELVIDPPKPELPTEPPEPVVHRIIRSLTILSEFMLPQRITSTNDFGLFWSMSDGYLTIKQLTDWDKSHWEAVALVTGFSIIDVNWETSEEKTIIQTNES
jgi:hypothetical protein